MMLQGDVSLLNYLLTGGWSLVLPMQVQFLFSACSGASNVGSDKAKRQRCSAKPLHGHLFGLFTSKCSTY